MTKYVFRLDEDTAAFREHRQAILTRDQGMCQACGAGGHQLCRTRSGDFCCCRQCAAVAIGTSFPAPTSLIHYIRQRRNLLQKSRS